MAGVDDRNGMAGCRADFGGLGADAAAMAIKRHTSLFPMVSRIPQTSFAALLRGAVVGRNCAGTFCRATYTTYNTNI